jgi:hypothetical protein
MRMLVIVLQADLVHMPVRVRHPVMGVLMLMLDVLVIVRRMRVRVPNAVMLMLMRVRHLVRVLLSAHLASVIACYPRCSHEA